MTAELEHTNFTVTDPDATAKWMCKIFDWQVRWEGESSMGGKSVHVGTEHTYLALYAPERPKKGGESSYLTIGGLNHIAVTVDDLDATEAAILAHGFETGMHADYEPGRRFYFHDTDGIEFEVVSYS